MKKRSVSIRGHATSFSLEDAFWIELKSIARAKGFSVAQLVTSVDASRAQGDNLSSALRVYILEHVKARQQS